MTPFSTETREVNPGHARTDTHVAQGAAIFHLETRRAKAMTAIPRACTTAAAIRRNATEPAMDGIARATQRLNALARIDALLRELVALTEQDRGDLRLIAGFSDSAAQRLDIAERAGSYGAPDIVSEMPSARHVAKRINTIIDTLKAGEDTAARENLRAIFETFGASLFEQRFTYHIGKARLLTLRGEYDRWARCEDVAA